MKKIAFNSLLACSSFLPIIPIVSCSHNDININSNKIVCYAIENVLKPGVNLFIGSIYDALKQSDIEFIENIIKSENRDTFLANVNLCLDTAKNDIANFKSFEVHKKDFIYSDVVLKLFRMNIKKNNSLIDDVKAVLKKDNILSLLNVFIGDGLIDRWNESISNKKINNDMFTKDIKNSLSVQKIVVEIIKQFYPDITTDQEALDEYYQKLNKLSDYEYIEYDMDPDMKLRTVPIYENNYWDKVHIGDIVYWHDLAGGHTAIIDKICENMYTTPEGNNVPQLFRTIESSNGGVQYGFVDESHCGNIYRINGLNDEQIESTIKWAEERIGNGYNFPAMLPQSIKSYASGIEDSWYCSEFAYAAFFNGAHVSINNDDYLKNSDVFSQPGYTPDNLWNYTNKEIIFENQNE